MHTEVHHIGGRIDGLLSSLWQSGGTDLLLSVGLPPMMRIDSTLHPAPGARVLTADDTDALLAEVLTPEQGKVWADSHEYDFSFSWRDDARIRGNAFTQRGLTAVALRMIPRSIPSPDALGLPPVLRELSLRHQGLVLMTGPTGSGKSTTLASLIDLINSTRGCHIITIEDPIEYLHPHKNCLVNQREVHADTHSFSNALRASLRQDPDVVLIGELRDLETTETALRIAETGHLTFGTLHTNSAYSTINRVIDIFPAHQQSQIRAQLSLVLEGIVCQALLPKANGSGRCMAMEVLVPNAAIRNLIREDKVHQIYSMMQTGQEKYGMQTFNQSLATLYFKKMITLELALQRSSNPDELQELINRGAGVVAGAGMNRPGMMPQRPGAPGAAPAPRPPMGRPQR